MSHLPGPFVRRPELAQLVLRPERAVEEEAVGSLGRGDDLTRQAADRREIDEDPPGVAFPDAKADVLSAPGRMPEPFEVDGNLSRNGKRLDREPARGSAALRQLNLAAEGQIPPGHLAGKPLQRAVEHVVLDEAAPYRLGGVHDERIRFAQAEQSQRVVEVAVGEEDPFDRRVAQPARVQRRKAFDLSAHFRGGIEQEPRLAVRAHCYAFLGTRFDFRRSIACPTAVPARAVPLRATPSGCRAEHLDLHVLLANPDPPTRREGRPLPRGGSPERDADCFGLTGPRPCRTWPLHPS